MHQNQQEGLHQQVVIPQSPKAPVQTAVPEIQVPPIATDAPSSVKICHALLSSQPATIEESKDVCRETGEITQSLSQIFLSAFLAQTAASVGIPIVYSHGCASHRTDDRVVFQMTLPEPLRMPDTTNDSEDAVGTISGAELGYVCQQIFDIWTRTGGLDATFILSRNDILSRPPVSHASQRRQLRGVSTNQQRRLQTDRNDNDNINSDSDSDNNGSNIRSNSKEQGVEPKRHTIFLLEKIRPIVRANLREAAVFSREMPGAVKAGYGVLGGSKTGGVATDSAVVYLPCHTSSGNDVVVLSYMHYLFHIPVSVAVVDILMDRRCVQGDNNLAMKYAGDFASTVRQFLPRANVELILTDPSSADVIARLVEAEYVMCGPGYGRTCLFPTIATSQPKDSAVSTGSGNDGNRFVLYDAGEDLIPGTDSVSTILSRLPRGWTNHVHPPRDNFEVAQLSAFRHDPQLLSTFAQSSPDESSGNCRFVRGRVGNWVQDMEYAATAQYRTPLAHYSGNAERHFRKKVEKKIIKDMDFRPPTTYRWVESRYQTCQTSLVSKHGVCDLLSRLDVRRIFALGDSLSLQMAQSLWMWLSSEGNSPTPKGTLEPNFQHTISCPAFDFTLQYIRNDEFLENDLPVSIDQKQSNCASYCYPWTEQYRQDSSRTILIANNGAHIHSADRFREAVHRFMNVVDGMNRPDDIVLWRSLVPGHWDCGRHGLTPFQNYAEYLGDAQQHDNVQDEAYSWSKFASYNDYVTKTLDKRRYDHTGSSSNNNTNGNNGNGNDNGNPNSPRRATMEVVDVFPVTVLRPDGHCSDEFRPPKYSESDCLHYTLPGPIDWWSHMVYSHLLDMAQQRAVIS